MAYVMSQNLAGGQPLSAVSTTKKHDLRQLARAVDSTNGEGWFIYAQASVAIVQYDAVVIKANGKAVKTNEANYKLPGDLAFAQIAFAADEYGWFQRSGLPLVRLTSSTEKEVPLYVNASDGVLSGATASCKVIGLVPVTSVTSTVNAVTCVAQFPILSWGANLNQI